ncbi:MAG: ferritin-like domain-containing protein [Myxococcales bacterium]
MGEASDYTSREQLVHSLYEAAELEHNLMCTYLYAAFSLRSGEAEGLSREEAEATARWRATILRVAIEEMSHLTMVWNITSALGATPRFGRGNFPLDPGILPAGVVVKLAPFSEAVLQHFIFLERPEGSTERDGAGFEAEFRYRRGLMQPRITPMAMDYDTVGTFYATLGARLSSLVARVGERSAMCGDPALQLSNAEVELVKCKPVICAKTALAAFEAIVRQGEGAPADATDSHYQRFLGIRSEMAELKAKNPNFSPAFFAAVNPVLRPPMRPEGRVFIESEEAASVVDVANTGYGMMLRLLAYSYVVPRPAPEKQLAVDLGVGLMRAFSLLAERAARLPVGPSHPNCNAGVSFTALRDASPFPPGPAAERFFVERLEELAVAAERLPNQDDTRVHGATRYFRELHKRAAKGFGKARAAATSQPQGQPAAPAAPPAIAASAKPAESAGEAAAGNESSTIIDGVEHVEGKHLKLLFEAKRCIHARFCVTGAPDVFLANVKGPWIHPDAMDAEELVAIAHACPSGAIRYERKDGRPNEACPPVNLIAVREAGPYAVRGELLLDGDRICNRATLCRCGASKHKPYCDGSHHDVGFSASGEPATGTQTEMLPVRNGPLEITPQLDGPLQVRGNLEITSGTGRMVARVTSTRLCRCGGSSNKPFCDGTHARIGFKSE